ncbi:MAG: histidine phosphatase family protein, partial [bacterium]
TVKDGLREVDIDREKALSVMGDEDPYERYDSWSSTLEDFRWGSFEFAESSESLRDRVRSTLSSIVDNHPGETVVIFSHTGVINAYLADCLGLESDLLTLPAHTGLSTVRTLGNKRAVVTINDYSHLR